MYNDTSDIKGLLSMRRTKGLRACMVLLACGACVSGSTLHTARPLKKGDSEIIVAPAMRAVDFEDGLPNIELVYRRGIDHRMDIGLKLTNWFMFEVDFNYALVTSEHFALSFDPSVTVGLLPPQLDLEPCVDFCDGDDDNMEAFGHLWATLLADVGTRDGVTFTLGVKSGRTFMSEVDGAFFPDRSLWAVGGSIGVRAFGSRGFSAHPEFSVVYPLEADDGYIMYTFSLGLVF